MPRWDYTRGGTGETGPVHAEHLQEHLQEHPVGHHACHATAEVVGRSTAAQQTA